MTKNIRNIKSLALPALKCQRLPQCRVNRHQREVICVAERVIQHPWVAAINQLSVAYAPALPSVTRAARFVLSPLLSPTSAVVDCEREGVVTELPATNASPPSEPLQPISAVASKHATVQRIVFPNHLLIISVPKVYFG